MVTKLYTLCLIYCLHVTVAAAQNWIQPLSPGASAVSVQQLGDFNQALISQQNTGTAINLTQVVQFGNANTVSIVQMSAQHEQISVLQSGDANLYQLQTAGNINAGIVVQQSGDNNIIRQSLIQSEGVQIDLVQRGVNNEINHSLRDASQQSFRIIQEGNGLKVTIIQGAIGQ